MSGAGWLANLVRSKSSAVRWTRNTLAPRDQVTF